MTANNLLQLWRRAKQTSHVMQTESVSTVLAVMECHGMTAPHRKLRQPTF